MTIHFLHELEEKLGQRWKWISDGSNVFCGLLGRYANWTHSDVAEWAKEAGHEVGDIIDAGEFLVVGDDRQVYMEDRTQSSIDYKIQQSSAGAIESVKNELRNLGWTIRP